MDVYGYDPYISVDAAWGLSKRINHATMLKTIFDQCDYITLHVPLSSETKEMLNADVFKNMKPGMRIINFSRGELVNNSDLKDAIEKKIVACYVTDFPCKEVIELTIQFVYLI
jgi:D-3-phosphoglycerate dehydrogenase